MLSLSLSLRINAFPSMLLLLMGNMDCITTVIGIMYFGAVECNPLMAGIISTNIPAFIVLKLATTVFVCLIFVQANKILNKSQNKTSRAFTAIKKLLKTALIGVIAFLVVVVSNNLVVLDRQFKHFKASIFLGFVDQTIHSNTHERCPCKPTQTQNPTSTSDSNLPSFC